MSLLRRIGDVLVVALAVVADLVPWNGDRLLRTGGELPLWVIPVATVICYATLLLRWQHPVGVFALIWGFASTSLVVPGFQPFAGPLVALHAVASRLPARTGMLALASLIVPFGSYSWTSAAYRDRATTSMELAVLQLLVLWMLLAAAVWGVGRLSYRSARRAWRLQELRAAESAEAVRAERMRLGRELHDIVSHAVVTMIVQASAAKAILAEADERVDRALGVIEDSGAQAMSELHRMLRLLDSVDHQREPEPASQPGLGDIAHLVQLARAAGRAVELTESGPASTLDPSVAGAAYRIVQESLTNSLKYAGPAAPVGIRLTWTGQSLHVVVADRAGPASGALPQPSGLSSGHGLDGLRERVKLVGGMLSAEPTADGFVVRADLPLAGDPLPIVEGPIVEGPIVEGPIVEGPIVEGPIAEVSP